MFRPVALNQVNLHDARAKPQYLASKADFVSCTIGQWHIALIRNSSYAQNLSLLFIGDAITVNRDAIELLVENLCSAVELERTLHGRSNLL